jgi:hypothetical protein
MEGGTSGVANVESPSSSAAAGTMDGGMEPPMVSTVKEPESLDLDESETLELVLF